MEKDVPALLAPWLSIIVATVVTGLIYSALKIATVGALLGARPLVFIGKISFSIYLLHMFIIRIVMDMPDLSSAAAGWLSLILILLCATLSYWAIESPGMRIGRVISNKLRIANLAYC
jgi:peptidoglycan/LPS O-acetylase OafA/YrhL